MNIWYEMITEQMVLQKTCMSAEMLVYLSQVLYRHQNNQALVEIKPFTEMIKMSSRSASVNEFQHLGELCLVASGLKLRSQLSCFNHVGQGCFALLVKQSSHQDMVDLVYRPILEEYNGYLKFMNGLLRVCDEVLN